MGEIGPETYFVWLNDVFLVLNFISISYLEQSSLLVAVSYARSYMAVGSVEAPLRAFESVPRCADVRQRAAC